MSLSTPFLRGFAPPRLRRASRQAVAQLQGLDSLEEFYKLLGHLFQAELLDPVADGGPNSRERVFSPKVTFWAFVAQVLSPDSPCRETVRRVEAWWRRTTQDTWGGPALSHNTSAYCQARARLDLPTLALISSQIAWSLERGVLRAEEPLGQRTLKIVDGTMLSMPDTPANQALWPQSKSQQPGLGFPALKLVGLFSLASGALLASATGSIHQHESTLFGTLWPQLRRDDVILADRGFCSYVTLAGLRQRGVDSLMRLGGRREVDFRRGRRLGHADRLVTWTKPRHQPPQWSEQAFAALAPTQEVRLIRCRVPARGARTKTVVLVTTLLDPVAYPADTLRALYAQRWLVEGHFLAIKELLAMDILRCKSPALIEREVAIHAIAYNLVRALMQRAAHCHQVPLARISFKGSVDALRHWSTLIAAASAQPKKQDALIAQLLATLARDALPLRPGRNEPRVKKRRPKRYPLMPCPRHEMSNHPSRHIRR